jgi:outer membrane protein
MDIRQALISSTRVSLVAAAALLAVAGSAQAAAGDIVVRGRVLQLEPANESYGPSTGVSLAGDVVSVSDRLIWELDASYFITNNLAVEVIATTPPKHTVYLGGTRIGTLRHLPPTVTLQYHIAPTNASVRPYIGLGVNYTHLSAVNLDAGSVLGGSVPLKAESSSWGTAIQLGADFPINDKLSINVDFKKIDISTKVSVKANGAYLGTVKVNPVLFGAGVGYKF